MLRSGKIQEENGRFSASFSPLVIADEDAEARGRHLDPMTKTPDPGGEITPPTLADLEALAQAALETVPAELKRHVGDVVIRVDEFPDEETESEMGLESPFD